MQFAGLSKSVKLHSDAVRQLTLFAATVYVTPTNQINKRGAVIDRNSAKSVLSTSNAVAMETLTTIRLVGLGLREPKKPAAREVPCYR